MKKRLFSILTALCLCMALLPTAAFAATGTALKQDNISSYMTLSSGSYYLSEDITLTDTLTITGTVTLDLNGHVLKMVGTHNGNYYVRGSVIKVASGAKLTLEDSRPDASHSGDYTSLPVGGIITGGKAAFKTHNNDTCGGGVYVSGEFIMNGGTIYQCIAQVKDNAKAVTGKGGGVYVLGGSFTMKGGTIDGCSAYEGGGVCLSSATFNMTGGTIQNCSATTDAGGVCVSGIFNMTDGTIKSCSATENGSGVFVYANHTFTMFGKSIIDDCAGNAVYLDGTSATLIANGGEIKSNVYVYSYAKITHSQDVSDYTTFSGDVNVHRQGIVEDSAKLTVTFNSNGGTTVSEQKVLKGQKATKPDAPTRTGYAFGGWYKESACTTAFDFDTVITDNIALYAKWTHTAHTGGTATCQAKAICEVCREPYGELGAHDFAIENKDATGALKTAGNCQHEAVYYKSCSVCGTVSTSDADTFNGDKEPNTHTGTLGEWQKDSEKHWQTYSCCPTVKGNEGAHSFGTDGVCECGAVKFTVTFDSNGGSVETKTAATDISGKLTLAELPTPTRDGYRFDGWFTAQKGGTEVTLSTTFYKTATVYAHWTYVPVYIPAYTVSTPSAANGSVTVTPKNAAAGVTVTVTVTPDKGYALETLSVTNSSGGEIELTDLGNGKYSFKMPACPVTVAASFLEDNTMLNFFVDVPADKYYYDAVLWAAKNGITGGVDETHFGPPGRTAPGRSLSPSSGGSRAAPW